MGVKSLPLELILEIMLYVFIDVRGKPHKQFEALSTVCRVNKLVFDRISSNYLWSRYGHHMRSVYCFVMSGFFIQELPWAFWQLHVLRTRMNPSSV
jgi:hypothetical protein